MRVRLYARGLGDGDECAGWTLTVAAGEFPGVSAGAPRAFRSLDGRGRGGAASQVGFL